MRFSEAIDGFLLFKAAESLSPQTLAAYRAHLERAALYLDDPPLKSVTTADIVRFLAWLRTDYQPRRLNGDTAPVSGQTLRNAWTALKSFYRWSTFNVGTANIMADGLIPRPKAVNQERQPLTAEEVRRLLASIQPRRATRPKSGTRYQRDLRDRALILTFLDTGIRSGELCAVSVGDLHAKSGQLDVLGKGAKRRRVLLGATTRAAVWQYLQERPDGGDPAAPLFATLDGGRLAVSWVGKHLRALGDKAGVEECYPHRLRYTFAIQYLRNGGDVFTLQALLGHSSLKMVRYYLRLAQSDVAAAHRRASPVDGWFKP